MTQTTLIQNFDYQLLFGVTHISLFASLFCTFLLWTQRKDGERSRLYLCFTWAIFCVVCLIRTLALYVGVEYHYMGMLPLKLLIEGLVTITIMVIYPITVINRRWLNVRHTLLICSPLIILYTVSKIMETSGVEFRDIHSFAELFNHWHEPNILIRLTMVLVTLTFYYIISWIPKNKARNNTSITWVNGFIVASQVFSLFYIGRLVIEGYLISTLQVGYAVLALVYITYQEIFVRLIRHPVCTEAQIKTETETETYTDTETDTDSTIVIEQPINESATASRQVPNSKDTNLFDRLEQCMNSTKLWRDPDLSAEKLVTMLYTNRTRLSKSIQQHGYSSYSSYVNGKRVAEFIQIITLQGGGNYQQTLFDVGFRSKTSALRNFKEITGMTPSEYFSKTDKK